MKSDGRESLDENMQENHDAYRNYVTDDEDFYKVVDFNTFQYYLQMEI